MEGRGTAVGPFEPLATNLVLCGFAREKYETIDASAHGTSSQLRRNVDITGGIYEFSTHETRPARVEACQKALRVETRGRSERSLLGRCPCDKTPVAILLYRTVKILANLGGTHYAVFANELIGSDTMDWREQSGIEPASVSAMSVPRILRTLRP